MRNVPIVATLLFYLLSLVDLTLFQYPVQGVSPNFMPFRTIVADLLGGGSGFWSNFCANLILLIPLGILLPSLIPKRIGWRTMALMGALVSLAIESAQLVSGYRVADVDDVILNTLSALIGFAIFQSARPWIAARKTAEEDDEEDAAALPAGVRRDSPVYQHRPHLTNSRSPYRPH